MAHALEDLGVDIIEAGFAMASEGDFAAIATITQAIRKPRIASLARAKTEDIEMAARALQFADRARIHVFLASSDLHLEYKLKISRQEALDLCRRIGAPGALACRRRRVLARRRHPLRPRFPGGNGPHRRRSRRHHHQHARHRGLHHARRIRPDVPRSARAHSRPSTRRASSSPRTATTTSAWPSPTRWPPSRPAHGRWNAPSTASASAPAMRLSKKLPLPFTCAATATASPPASSSTNLYPTSEVLGQIITFKPSPNKAIVGANAFAHESGIHQHGMLANPLCYEIMTPALVGVVEDAPGARQALRPRGAAPPARAARLHRSAATSCSTSTTALSRWPTARRTSTTRTWSGFCPTRFASGAACRLRNWIEQSTRAANRNRDEREASAGH